MKKVLNHLKSKTRGKLNIDIDQLNVIIAVICSAVSVFEWFCGNLISQWGFLIVSIMILLNVTTKIELKRELLESKIEMEQRIKFLEYKMGQQPKKSFEDIAKEVLTEEEYEKFMEIRKEMRKDKK